MLESPPDSKKTEKRVRPGFANVLLLTIVAMSLALLRIAPALTFQTEEDRVFLGFPYSIEDSLQYADFVAQAKDHDSILFSNRFTLDEQTPRMIILPIYLIGRLAAALDLEIATAWTIAQALFIFLFVILWYWFVGIFFKDPPGRLFAFVFILLAGGLDGWVVLLGGVWPDAWAAVLKRDLWVVLGWTPYMTMYNPLYLAGWLVLLPWLAITKKAFDKSLPAAALSAALLPIMYLIHAYDAVVAMGTVAMIPLHPLLTRFDTKAFLRALLPAAIIATGAIPIALIARWQLADPLFAKVTAESQSGLFVSPDMWLLGFGGIFLAGIYGMSTLRKNTTNANLLFGWLLAAAMLSFSPFFEGRHFLYFVSLPLGLAAVFGLVRLKNKISWTGRKKAFAAAIVVLVFGNSFVRTSIRAFAHPYKDKRMTISKSELSMAQKLRTLPRGGVLASRNTCLWLPHLSDHECVMGHWFLTWDMARKMAMFKRMISENISPQETDTLLKKFGARYMFWGPVEARMGRIPRPMGKQLLPLAKTKDTILMEIRQTDQVK